MFFIRHEVMGFYAQMETKAFTNNNNDNKTEKG